MPLAALGTTSYNGVSFGVLFKSKVTYTPVPDQARRTVAYTRGLWEVEGYVAAGTYDASPGDSTDDDINVMRKNLLQPGGILNIQGHGLGDTYINGGNVRDVLWGPWPKILDFQPFADKTCFVKYQIEWHVPTQCDNPRTRFGIMEFNFDWSVSIDKGITTRTITGYITIPQSRNGVNVRTLLDNADRYRERIVPIVPIGFDRKQNYHLDYAKGRLEFQIQDIELATQNPYPDGITEGDVRASLNATGKRGPSGIPTGAFLEWDWTISGTLTVAPNLPTSAAWGKFLLILASRYNWLQANLNSLHGLPGGTIQANLKVIPVSAGIDESLFTLSSSFRVSYLILAFTGIRTVLRASGLWRPIEGTSHVAWNYSMLPAAHHPRGRAKMAFPNTGDVIVDLCETNYPTLNVGVPSLTYNAQLPPGTPCPTITPTNSWSGWVNTLTTQIKGGTVFHKPLGKGAVDVKQVKHDDDYEIIMTGHAQRVRYPIKTPKLLFVNGRTVTLVGNNAIENEVVAVWCGHPIYFSKWLLRYKLDKAPPEYNATFRPDNKPYNSPGENTVTEQEN